VASNCWTLASDLPIKELAAHGGNPKEGENPWQQRNQKRASPKRRNFRL
jgi:hypothetical protein